MKSITLLLMGSGGVGCQLLQHTVSCRSLHAQQGDYLRVVGVCGSKSLVAAPDVISRELMIKFYPKFAGLSRYMGNSESKRRRVKDFAALLGKATVLACRKPACKSPW
ncbi:homoserine dehydrogenase family protein [Salix suchowensis]|nr:homoserine dehydrogenase family protein [Salix suchowensis]